MKKVLSVILALAIFFAFFAMVGCSNEDDANNSKEHIETNANGTNNDKTENSTSGDDEITQEMLENSLPNEYVPEKLLAGMEVNVAQCYGTLNDPFFQELCNDITEYLEAQGCTVIVNAGTEEDLTDHLQRAENLLEMELALFILNTATPEAWADFNTMCAEKGCYLFLFGAKPTFFDEMYGAVLNVNETVFGEAMGRAAVAWLDYKYPNADKGEVKAAVFLMNTGVNYERLQTAHDVIAADPRVDIVYTTDYALTLDEGYKAMEEAMIYDNEIRLMICFSGDVAIGADNLLSSMGYDKSDFGFFCSGTSESLLTAIDASANDGSAIRGTVVQGAVKPASETIAEAAFGLLTGDTELRSETMETLQAVTSFGFNEITEG